MHSLAIVSPFSGLLLSFLGLGLPLGTPPEKEDAIMAHVAPSDCIAYTTWAARAQPNSASANQTEQLLAEPEVQRFIATLHDKALAAALAAAKKNGAPPAQADQVGQAVSLFLRTLFTKSGAAYLARLEPDQGGVEVQAAVIIKAGDNAPELAQALTDLFKLARAPVTEVTLVGRPFRQLSIPGPQPLDFVWSSLGGYFMMGLGSSAIEDLSARIKAQKEPTWLTELKSNLPVERRSSITYINIRKLVNTFVPLGGPEADRVAASFGFKQIVSYQAVSGLNESGMISRSLLALDGEPRGLLTLLDENGLAPKDLKHIPADSLSAAAAVLDLRKALDVTLKALEEGQPQAAAQAKQGLAQAQAMLGIDVAETLKALGTHWSFYMSGSGGALSGALAVDVRNKDRLVELEKQILLGVANEAGEIPRVGRINKSDEVGQIITTLTLSNPAPAAPSWCITDSRLVVGINPQSVKSVLARATTDKSLAELPQVASLLAEKSGRPPLHLNYYDTPRAIENMYGQFVAMLPIINGLAQQSGIPFALDSAQLPAQQTLAKHLQPSVSTMRRTAKGLEMETQQTFPGVSVSPASAGIAVALLLPAVQAAREAARRAQSTNYMRQQLIALHSHHDVHKALPAAYSSTSDGKPLLSWRVAILPFIEQKPLYDQFHLNEPWDSPHNHQLIDKMPTVFRSPNSAAKPGTTIYLAVGGSHGIMPAPQAGSSKGIAFSSIKDGTSNTIAIVEATDALAVEWTKPVEWIPDQTEPSKGLLGLRPGGFLAGFADGSAKFISMSIDPRVLGFLFSRDDGNVIPNLDVGPPPGPRPPPPANKAKGPGKRPPQKKATPAPVP